MANIDKEVKIYIQRLRSIYMCSNTIGQIMIDLMVNPPTQSECDDETCEIFHSERSNFLKTLAKRAEIANDWFQKMKDITCQSIEATFYAFPQIKISEKARENAKQKFMSPDMFFAMEGIFFDKFFKKFKILIFIIYSFGKNRNYASTRMWFSTKRWNSSFSNDCINITREYFN